MRYPEFNERLKKLVDSEGGNIKAFAEKCGVDYRVMHRYVAKGVQPSPIILKRIVENTDVNPVWLLTGEGPMFKSELSSFRSPEQIRQEMLHSSGFYDLPEGLRNFVYNEDKFNGLGICYDEMQFLKSPAVAEAAGATGGTPTEDWFVFMLERYRTRDSGFSRLDKIEETMVNLFRELDEEKRGSALDYLNFLASQTTRKKKRNPAALKKLKEKINDQL